MAVSPAGAGATDPAPGSITEPTLSPVAITAYPSSGKRFAGWQATANASVIDPASDATSVILSGDATVTAVFAEAGGGAWTNITGDVAGAQGVMALLSATGGDVYVGGWFAAAGGLAANSVAKYSSTAGTWSDVGDA